jgi:hypothetical protein
MKAGDDVQKSWSAGAKIVDRLYKTRPQLSKKSGRNQEYDETYQKEERRQTFLRARKG